MSAIQHFKIHDMTRLSLSVLVLLSLLIIFTSCSDDKLYTVDIEFYEPLAHELSDAILSPGDILRFSLRASIPNGEIRPFEVGLARYTVSGSRQPSEILFREMLVSENLEEIFQIEWELPIGLPESSSEESEFNAYRIIITRNPDRQPLDEGGNWLSTVITVVDSTE